MSETDITPEELSARMIRGDAIVILDVREPWEYDTAHIAPSVLLPLGQLTTGADELDRNATYVTLCHHGMRSDMAANWMRQHGFTNVLNLVGGIDAWSESVDGTVARY